MPSDNTPSADVLFLLGAYQLRGSVARGLALAECLSRGGTRLRVVSTDTLRFAKPPPPNLTIRISRHLTWPGAGALAKRYLKTDLRQDLPDLIDVQHRSLHPVGAWLARKLRLPYIITVYDYLRDREVFGVDPQYCRRVIAISDSVRAELLQRTTIPEHLVTVIPTGIEPPPAAHCPRVLKPGRAPVIGTTGALEAGKGLDLFLRAAVRIRQRVPGTLFLIAGSGPEERSLRLLARDLGLADALTVLPNLHHFGPALRAIDIFVLPALKQGLASTMLEAMAYGLPVIATESGGVRSVVTQRVTGTLVPPASVEGLVDQAVELLTTPDFARALGTAAREHILAHYSLDAMVRGTGEVYARVLRESPPAAAVR